MKAIYRYGEDIDVKWKRFVGESSFVFLRPFIIVGSIII